MLLQQEQFLQEAGADSAGVAVTAYSFVVTHGFWLGRCSYQARGFSSFVVSSPLQSCHPGLHLLCLKMHLLLSGSSIYVELAAVDVPLLLQYQLCLTPSTLL